jgi:hypothetical protein
METVVWLFGLAFLLEFIGIIITIFIMRFGVYREW